MLPSFEILPFFIGILAGYIASYFVASEPKTVYRYPNPDPLQAKLLTYRDKNGMCYKYIPNIVKCDEHEATLKDYPIQ